MDAFTDTPIKGNPAAVCVLPQEGDEDWMQNLATEMNLSEGRVFLSGQVVTVMRGTMI